ncbi:MAG: hypothetical protein KDJ25_00050, partial [Rhodoblastus sp.]|nr:hypothetical protein [Rhodoblastus sp.]
RDVPVERVFDVLVHAFPRFLFAWSVIARSETTQRSRAWSRLSIASLSDEVRNSGLLSGLQ